MSTREILIANTKTQKKSKLESNATTLGELKEEMRNSGIDYDGMTFTEGISKTQLLSDDTQLPQNVMYHGQPTNHLVILLTNTKKNIASGAMSRKEVYQAIKDYDLQDAVKEEFGRNYTQIPTSDLEVFINNNVDSSDEDEVETEDIDEEGSSYSLEDIIIDARITSVSDSLYVHIAQLALSKEMTVKDVEDLQDSLNIIINAMQDEEKETEIKSEPISTSDGLIDDKDIDNMLKSL